MRNYYTLINSMGSGGGSVPLLLDTYSGATAAYSLRKLNTAYTGYAIRVRRSSDNASQDIGFLNGSLDTSAITTFVGANDGYVSIWYDQSGNSKNATQVSLANQPQIVISGTLQTLNSKPTLYFDGASRYLDCGYLNGGTKPANYSTFALARYTLSSYNYSAIMHSNSAAGTDYEGYNMIYLWNSGRMVGQSSTGSNARFWYTNDFVNLNQRYLFEGHYKSNTSPYLGVHYWNNNLKTVTDWIYTAQNNSGTEFKTSIGRTGEYNGAYFKGEMQELVTYFSDQVPNRTGISTDINTHYSIY